MSSYLASSNNGVENHFVVREVVMAFESALTEENSHSPVSIVRRPILQQAPRKGKKRFFYKAMFKPESLYLETQNNMTVTEIKMFLKYNSTYYL